MKKLWEKNGTKLDLSIETFETEGDLLMDQKLIKYDVLGSIIHARALLKIGILSHAEFDKLQKAFEEILALEKTGQFNLRLGDEDMHTKIENYITEKYGEVGQKIHTGRSRNDQVLTAIRLYSKEQMERVECELVNLINGFDYFGKKFGVVSMPGYSHMQKAMPSSIGLWAGSFIESLKDDLIFLQSAYKLNNQSPLGSGAGYGVPIKLDRQYSAKLLGFRKVQHNPIYCQNSRGKIEAVIISSLVNILQTINKFATDVLLFTTCEFNFFQVSDNATTGSSMMPQKRNIDVAELLRSKVHLLLGYYTQVVSLSTNLTSGYNRDVQDTKKPLIESFEVAIESLTVTKILLQSLTPNKKVLEKALTPEIFAVEKTLAFVKNGMPFRQAYHKLRRQYK